MSTETQKALIIVGAYIAEHGFGGCWADEIGAELHDAGIKTADSSDLDPSNYEVIRLAGGTVIRWNEQWQQAEVA